MADRLVAALVKVMEGRSYVKEHYPLIEEGKFVGRTPAQEYDEALDYVLDWACHQLGIDGQREAE